MAGGCRGSGEHRSGLARKVQSCVGKTGTNKRLAGSADALPGRRGKMMQQIAELKQDKDLIHSIVWSMTPEEAVTLYLEWGNNWAHGRVVRSKEDVSNYFVVYA